MRQSIIIAVALVTLVFFAEEAWVTTISLSPIVGRMQSAWSGSKSESKSGEGLYRRDGCDGPALNLFRVDTGMFPIPTSASAVTTNVIPAVPDGILDGTHVFSSQEPATTGEPGANPAASEPILR